MKKLFRVSTIPLSLNVLLKGQLDFLNKHYDLTAISGEGSDLDEVRHGEGVKTYAIEIQRQISPVKDLQSLLNLYRYFKKEEPDIVHSITPKAGLLSMLAAKMAGVPVRIHTFTGLIFPSKTGAMQKLLIEMDRLLCRAATHIYPEGNGVKNDLLKFKITNKPLKVLANGNVNGIDLSYFDVSRFREEERQKLRTELVVKENDFVWVFVGRLVRDKGINELVAAFSELSSQNTNQKLLLVGPFEQELDPLLPETLNEIERNKNIISVGFQKDVRPYFSISDALVFPSYREGFPNVVLQAGAMGLPSIVTDINGCNEIITDGENGLIIPARDTRALEKAMLRMINDSELYSKTQSNARASIASRFAQEKVWQALLEEYQNVCGQLKTFAANLEI